MFENPRALFTCYRYILGGFDFRFEVVEPRLVLINPGDDGELPIAKAVDNEIRRPAIEAGVLARERSFLPFGLPGPAELQYASEYIVPIGDDLRRDGHGIAQAALHGESPAIGFGLEGADDNARREALR